MNQSAALLQQHGRVVGQSIVWGDWEDFTVDLDELDHLALQASHYPTTNYSHTRAITVKRYFLLGKSMEQLAKDTKGLPGYSLRSLYKDKSAIKRAIAQRNAESNQSTAK